ncbi:hypothetical protein B0T16DRAFT_459931 [Cercophora newfieldiana]|uniref:Fucose-specific lectin n=1 Tax=Cercophora newfieldiana TaxID=92897 RepID=A0AA39Y3G5_9PEZI|nr:hypothetical protein B0T16DRAFT_459931 [Cercophora newfieldiana]
MSWNPQQGQGIEVSPGYHNNGHLDDKQTVWTKAEDSYAHPTANDKYAIANAYPPEVVGEDGEEGKRLPVPAPTICGIRRKVFWIALGVATFVVLAAAIGGGVGGYFANRPKQSASESQSTSNSGSSTGNPTAPGPSSPTRAPVQNLSIAAVRWIDGKNVDHYRVFTQSSSSNQLGILESAWNSDGQAWSISPITDGTDTVKPGTSISASTGFPHTNTSFELVKTVFYVQPGGKLIERQSPYKEATGIWGNDNFSGLYSTSNASSVFSYWYQNMETRFHILATFFQELGANSLTVARYVENGTNWYPWRDTRHSISIQDGSPIAAAPAGNRWDLRLYVGGTDGTIKQYPYDLETNSLGRAVDTALEISPRSPFCVTIEDNRNWFSESTLPECARTGASTFVTHLLLFASTDRQSLSLVSWNCSSGFVPQQDRIQSLLKPNRTYLGLATTSDSSLTFSGQRVYVLFDEGAGPQVEEWEVPASGGLNTAEQSGPWKLRGEVPTTS